MTISINLNLAASTALALARAEASGARATRQISSGLRIGSAADDAAGLAISVHLTSRFNGLQVAARNANDGISLTQTAGGSLGAIADNLQRLRQLAVQSANATNSSSDRAALQLEAAQLVSEIDRVAGSTRFNGQTLLDGSFASANFQVGADAGQTIALPALADVRAAALGQTLGTAATLLGTALTAASTITGAGQLVINGVDVWRGVPIAADAKALAAAISAAGITGLSATAAANVAVGTWSNVGANGQFNINAQGALTFQHGAMTQAAAIADTINLINNTKPNLITDGGFEDGSLPGANLNYLYQPADQHPWLFGNGTGDTGNGSAFTQFNAPTPEGGIAAFVQTNGVLSQNFNVTSAGSYNLAFQMVQRAFYFSQSLGVVIDGQEIAQLPGPPGWTQYNLPSINLGAGAHTISFVGNATQDGTVFLDDIKLTAAGALPAGNVVATSNGSGVTLTAADGSNIGLNLQSGSPQIAGLGGIAYGVGSDGITYSHVDLGYAGSGVLSVSGSQAAALGLAGAPQLQYVGNFVSTIDLSSVAGANRALDAVDAALSTVDGQRAVLGATQNRLASTVTSVLSAAGNTAAARSRIIDADYGEAVGALTRSSILQQAGLAMIAQANLHAGDVLRLLKG